MVWHYMELLFFPHLFLTFGLFLTSYPAISIGNYKVVCATNFFYLTWPILYLVYLLLLILNSITRWSVAYWGWNLNLVWSFGDLFGVQE